MTRDCTALVRLAGDTPTRVRVETTVACHIAWTLRALERSPSELPPLARRAWELRWPDAQTAVHLIAQLNDEIDDLETSGAAAPADIEARLAALRRARSQARQVRVASAVTELMKEST